MSVYTTISESDLKDFLSHYSVGTLVSYEGIKAGIENTNYFVTTSTGEFVLTIFEQLEWNELPYFMDIMAFLAEHKVPSAHPVADKIGGYLRKIEDRETNTLKPVALVARLSGSGVDNPTPHQCAELGEALGRMHSLAHNFKGERTNPRGIEWCREVTAKLTDKLTTAELSFLNQELAFQATTERSDLPQGVIHADLFRDNALFIDDHLTGIIDFYYACNDALLYDIAVTVNDWCVSESGSLDQERSTNLLDSYQTKRQLTDLERREWRAMLRAAALRFWLSRLIDLHFPRPGEMTHIKDPDIFRKILLWHRENEINL
ncbi:MAG: homoserine kinase [Thiotrichales bacterium]|jgi:homoserine kinase type II|nr:homoserine kinase [Thiotrichales bacterium]MBT3614206.1 homoserine kinase [Thiotrichales bacterium]MBT3752024.1 homoserine kinase [Thiotrichales bacterium]MBT3837407.1 homoserine kinase [Thiotrichales bacterium]MBT4152692.1 homoserine kinase [Thiotrichales bacterium]